MAHSTTLKASRQKPEKPSPDFPLTPHPNGQWSKKIRGKVYYFGKWEDPQAALEKWLAEKDYRLAGRTPPSYSEAPTVDELVNKFLAWKRDRRAIGKLSFAMYEDYREVSKILLAHFGRDTLVEDLTPAGFSDLCLKLEKKNGAVRMRNLITRIKTFLIWGHKQREPHLCPHHPDALMAHCEKPEKSDVRKEKREKGPKYICAEDIRRLLKASKGSPTLHAAILLGINCGFENKEVSDLQSRDINLNSGWLDTYREKTGCHRRGKLWPETVEAIRDAIEHRTKPASDRLKDRVFLSRFGCELVIQKVDDKVRETFAPVAKKLEIQQGFSALRHSFRTTARACKDDDAVQVIMGHTDSRIDDHYIEEVEGLMDERLCAVANAVHKWLFEGQGKEK